MFSVLLHITNVLGTLAIRDYNVSKSPNLSLHFIKQPIPKYWTGKYSAEKCERLTIGQTKKWLFCKANALRTAHPRLPLTVKSTYQCPTEVTTQFKLSAKAKLTKLSLSYKQNSLHLLTLALAPAPHRLPNPPKMNPWWENHLFSC